MFFGAKMNEYAEKILFNRASLSSWCRMFDIENGKQNLKMLRLLNWDFKNGAADLSA